MRAAPGRPVPSVTVADLLLRSYAEHASAVAVVDGTRQVSYAELGTRAQRVGAALRARGLQQGDRVVLLSGNRGEYVEVDHAAFVSGFVRVALSPRLHPREVAHILQDCTAAALFVDPEWAQQLAEVVSSCLDLRLVVSFGEQTSEGVDVTYEDLLAQAPDAVSPPVRIGAEDVAALLYTSGTTGLPKGAMLSHRNWVSMVRNCMVEMPPVDQSDSVLHVAPLSHFSGYVGAACFPRGATHVVIRRFDPAETLELVRTHGTTILPLVPTMINMMTIAGEQSGRTAGTSLRALVYGGSAIAPDHLRRAREVFGDVFLQFYGLSETPMPLASLSRAAHLFDAAAAPPARLGSAGRPSPFVELRLLAEDGTDVSAGQVGEIVVRGDSVMLGYWGKPQETAQMIDEDGWAHTGDLGLRDDEGYLHVVDRKKDLVITGGYNVYPSEVENAIATLPAVQEVAVVAAPDERWGESIVAVVVAAPGHRLTEADVVEACASRLASYKKPRRVVFRDGLPKTGSGKIQRRLLRDQFWAVEERGTAPRQLPSSPS